MMIHQESSKRTFLFSELFKTNIFYRYSSSPVRKSELLKYVDKNHPVFKTEIEILAKVEKLIKDHINEVVGDREVDAELAKIIITFHVLETCKSILSRSEVYEELGKSVYDDTCSHDFSKIFVGTKLQEERRH